MTEPELDEDVLCELRLDVAEMSLKNDLVSTTKRSSSILVNAFVVFFGPLDSLDR